MKMRPNHFEKAIACLEQRRESLIQQLKQEGAGAALIDEKAEIDTAIATLQFCIHWNILPTSPTFELPATGDAFGCYRLFELDENDVIRRSCQIAGEDVDIYGGTVVLRYG